MAEERYLQQVITTTMPKALSWPSVTISRSDVERRQLRSEFLIGKLPEQNPWLPSRNVFEVDGRSGRDGRLA